ncbi:MAG: hypothetical protein VX105_02605 [Cyanobacteriota bacterium]|nr:hypothetical protein [Cyanobacteriota bacterium]
MANANADRSKAEERLRHWRETPDIPKSSTILFILFLATRQEMKNKINQKLPDWEQAIKKAFNNGTKAS